MDLSQLSLFQVGLGAVALVASFLGGVQWGRKNPSKAEELAAKFRMMEDQLKEAQEKLKSLGK